MANTSVTPSERERRWIRGIYILVAVIMCFIIGLFLVSISLRDILIGSGFTLIGFIMISCLAVSSEGRRYPLKISLFMLLVFLLFFPWAFAVVRGHLDKVMSSLLLLGTLLVAYILAWKIPLPMKPIETESQASELRLDLGPLNILMFFFLLFMWPVFYFLFSEAFKYLNIPSTISDLVAVGFAGASVIWLSFYVLPPAKDYFGSKEQLAKTRKSAFIVLIVLLLWGFALSLTAAYLGWDIEDAWSLDARTFGFLFVYGAAALLILLKTVFPFIKESFSRDKYEKLHGD